jgi:hypothetical protein
MVCGHWDHAAWGGEENMGAACALPLTRAWKKPSSAGSRSDESTQQPFTPDDLWSPEEREYIRERLEAEKSGKD